MHVCVLGAGIVGLASAYALQQAGHTVTVIDRASPGAGASGGNGAQLSYSYVQPLADPAIWRQLPKLLLSPTSPLTVRPQLDIHQWLWGLRFLAACRPSVSHATTVALLQLAAESRLAFDTLLTQEKLACEHSATGKLVLFSDATAWAAANAQMHRQALLGSVQTAVSAQQCVALEPALAHYQRHIIGAIHTPSECAADCQKTCDALHMLLLARGVRFLLDASVQKIAVHGGMVTHVSTTQGSVQADRYVMALGAESAPLARTLGVYLPLYPLRGYSITLNVHDTPGAAPIVNVTDTARKVVFARIGQRLRVAGMAEVAGYGVQIAPQRIASLQASTRALFPDCSEFTEIRPWAGLRPATPTGRPLIGNHPKAPANLLFNVGHGALGFTLAFGSAQRLRETIGSPR